MVVVGIVYSCCLFLLLFAWQLCWESPYTWLCFLLCCWQHCQCVKTCSPVFFFAPCQSCQALSECAFDPHFASGLPLLLSLMCAFVRSQLGLLLGAILGVGSSIDALLLRAADRHAYASFRYLAYVLQSGAHFSLCPSLLFAPCLRCIVSHYFCVAAHLHQADCSNHAAAKPSFISLLCD